MSADSVAHAQIRAFVDRILRLKEEARSINGDIREVYAEAKGNGFDKTVLGKVVSYVEKRAAGAADLAEAEALFDLYLSAYDGASHTHAYARDTVPVAKAGDEAETGAIGAFHDARADVATTDEVEPVSRVGSGRTLPATSEHMDATAGETATYPSAIGNGFDGTSEGQGATGAGTAGETPATGANSNVTPFRTHNPDKHFLNSKGLPRLHGCSNPEACAGSHRALCGSCAKAAEGSAA